MATGGYELSAHDILVSRKGKVILNKVSFLACPGTLTAIIGPNGAGKTTLMRALSGERPDEGRVMINGNDIYQNPEFWMRQIGYIPVDTILHENLTLQDALLFIGRLRLFEICEDKLKKKVDDLLTVFGFPPEDNRRNKLIKVLSSGELKRANICAELLIDPEIILLDEPTSNLDPNAEFEVMSLLANYAHNYGKTILVITHTLNVIDLCDEIIFVENGNIREKGRPEIILKTLAEELDINLVDSINRPAFYYWAQIFERTKTRDDERQNYVGSNNNLSTISAPFIKPRDINWFRQFRQLFNRYSRIRMNDKWSLLLTLLAGFSGFLFFVLPGNIFTRPFDFNERVLGLNQARQSIYLIAIVTTLLGLLTSYTEISKEFRIYSHEHLKGLSTSAYFLSKWLWLVLAVGILAPIFLLSFIVLVYHQPLPGFPTPRIGEDVNALNLLIKYQLVGLFTQTTSWLLLITMILSCISSVTVGLFVSAAAANNGRGYLYLSFVVVFLVLFSGLIRNAKVEEIINTLSYFSSGKWAYEGIASSLSLYCWIDSWRFDEFNSTGHIISIWLSLILSTIIAGGLSIIFLNLRDPWYRPIKNLRLLFSRNLTRTLLLVSVVILLFSYTVFLRQLSTEYHKLNYWSRSEYGGTNAYQYANIYATENPTIEQLFIGEISQSWCTKE